jgi:Tfp pilus assembly protein PilE
MANVSKKLHIVAAPSYMDSVSKSRVDTPFADLVQVLLKSRIEMQQI